MATRYTDNQGSRGSCSAQTDFAAFGEGVLKPNNFPRKEDGNCKRQASFLFSHADFAVFGEEVQLLFRRSPYGETEQLSRLTSPSSILATSSRGGRGEDIAYMSLLRA